MSGGNIYTCNISIINKSGGTISKTDNSTQNFTQPFINEAGGTVTLSAGTLRFNTGGSFENYGSFTAIGAEVEFLFDNALKLSTGSAFSGTTLSFSNGTVTIEASGVFAPDFSTVNLNGTITANAGTSLIIPAGTTCNWISGSFGVFSNIINNGTVLASYSYSHNTDTDITNYGTFSWAGGLLDANDGNTLTNYGTINIPINTIGSCYLSMINKPAGFINITAETKVLFNNQFINEAGGTVTSTGGITFDQGSSLENYGSITAAGETIELKDNVTVTLGTGAVFSGNTLWLNGGTQTIDVATGFVPDFVTITHNGQRLCVVAAI